MNDLPAILEQAMTLSGQERERFLASVCANDPNLRKRLADLLKAAEKADAFFGETQPMRDESGPFEGPGTVIDRYKLLQKIGEGGMGSVYMAEQRSPVVRNVAFKIVKVGMDTKSTVLDQLGSPSAQSTFDPNTWYYVTQISAQIMMESGAVPSIVSGSARTASA